MKNAIKGAISITLGINKEFHRYYKCKHYGYKCDSVTFPPQPVCVFSIIYMAVSTT